MEVRNQTENGSIKVGDKVLIRGPAGPNFPYWGVVRGVFTQHVLLQPYAENVEFEALILVEGGWCSVADVLSVSREGACEAV